MPRAEPHLFADISAHGLGHLAQAAPVLNRLAELVPGLRITVRSALSISSLQQRIHLPFTHIAAASDFGYIMVDALRIDREATAAAYRTAHADFSCRAAQEGKLLAELGVDGVFSDVSYLPLAGAALAGIPAVALCSLNWADLFEHFFGHEDWAPAIHAEMLAAYRAGTFLRTTPGMSMPRLNRVESIGPIACQGHARRSALHQTIGRTTASEPLRIVLIALGGIPARLPIESWPLRNDMHWLVPQSWGIQRPDITSFESLRWHFSDLLRSVDAVITKPGYGTFTEAVCNGTAVIYQRRDDWPEQDCLIDWLQQHGRHKEVSTDQLASGDLASAVNECLHAAVPPAPTFDGADMAARHLSQLLR